MWRRAIARNALASPTILGVNAGASFAIVTMFLLNAVSPTLSVWFACAGALGVSVLAPTSPKTNAR